MTEKDEIRAILMQINIDNITAGASSSVNLSPLDLFRAGHATKSGILCFAWMTACISYYALTLNSTQLNGHIIINFALIGITESPVAVILLLTLNQIGRRPLAFLGHLVLGVATLALAFIPKDQDVAVLVTFLVGKGASAIAFAMMYLITSEVYPTNLRSQAVGACSTISRVGCLLAPFLAPLAKVWQPLPMLALGLPALVSGVSIVKMNCLDMIFKE